MKKPKKRVNIRTKNSRLKKIKKEGDIVPKKEIKEFSEKIQDIKKELKKIIVGQDDIVDGLLRALICNGHVLVEGVPGTAKTLIIRALGEVSGCDVNRIQFTVDLLPTDITGLTLYHERRGFEIVKGPIFTNFLVADEINRAPPKCVLGDSPIILANGEVADIKDIIKRYNGKKTYNKNNECWIIPKNKLKLLAFDPSDYKIKPEEVKYLYKQKTSAPYQEVELKSGRKIKTSTIHPFFTLNDGKVETIQASELKKGECILIPRKLSISGNNKLMYNNGFLEKSKEINKEIERRKKLYAKVQNYKKEQMDYKIIKEKLKVDNKQDENLVKTFIRIKPRYLKYPGEGYFFSESKQFGQVHGIKKSEFVTEEFARFMAILIAEGSVNKSYFYLTMKDKELPELFIKLVKNLFGLDIRLLYDKKREQYRVAFRSDALVGLLKAVGYDPHFKAGEKYIPKFILSSTDEIVKEFLRTYYECDGCVSRDCIKVTTKSEKIANSLSYLLLRMGFVARINKELSKTKIGDYSYKRNFYNLRLYGTELYDFHKKINFLTERNSKKLENLIKTINRKNTDLIPGMHQIIRNFRKTHGISHKQFYDLTGMHAHNLENPKNALMHSRYRLGKIAESFSRNTDFLNIKKLVDGDFYCDFVKENRIVKPKKEYWLYDFSMKDKHSFVAGFGGIISHNTQSALLEAMQEKQVTIGRKTFSLPNPFFVMATQNPLEQAGVYTLPEAQIDRFIFKLLIEYPERQEEKAIMKRNINLMPFDKFALRKIITPRDILRMQELVKKIYLSNAIEDYITNLVEATRNKKNSYSKYIDWGASPRATINLFIASKAQALMKGRGFVVPEDVKTVALDVLRHRLILNYEAEAENITADKLINELLKKISPP